jgi:hypothetical protein
LGKAAHWLQLRRNKLLLNILSFLEEISNEALLYFGDLGKNRLGFGFGAQEQEVVPLGAEQSPKTRLRKG